MTLVDDVPQDTLPGLELARELQPCGRFEWERIVRRIVGERKGWKLVALAYAQYADPDGTRVRPGVPLLSAVCEQSERVVKRHTARLVEVGLLELVRRGGGPNGLATEYRLTVPSDLLEEVRLLPAERPKPDATRRGTQATQAARVRRDTPRNSGHSGGPSSAPDVPGTQATQVARVPGTRANDPPVTCSDARHQPPANQTTQVRDKPSTSPATRTPLQGPRFAVEGGPPPDGWRPPRRPRTDPADPRKDTR